MWCCLTFYHIKRSDGEISGFFSVFRAGKLKENSTGNPAFQKYPQKTISVWCFAVRHRPHCLCFIKSLKMQTMVIQMD